MFGGVSFLVLGVILVVLPGQSPRPTAAQDGQLFMIEEGLLQVGRMKLVAVGVKVLLPRCCLTSCITKVMLRKDPAFHVGQILRIQSVVHLGPIGLFRQVVSTQDLTPNMSLSIIGAVPQKDAWEVTSRPRCCCSKGGRRRQVNPPIRRICRGAKWHD